MEIEQLFSYLDKYGVSVGLVIYFLVKDWKFTQRLENLFASLDAHLTKLEQGEGANRE